SVSSTAPGANRRSGSSVRTSTVTSPRRPWALPIRPTTSRSFSRGSPSSGPFAVIWSADIRSARSAIAGRFDQVDADRAALERADHGAQRLGRAALASDDLAQVVGVHPDLEDPAAA